jgi:hypothetical protein
VPHINIILDGMWKKKTIFFQSWYFLFQANGFVIGRIKLKMEDGTEYVKLPVEERCVHKVL